jgi:pSer/pThr/pTyr-binding forkhead associated (FHA) protein
MNYVLQVVKGRSASTTLKLRNGVTSIGRHDDCLIRIKSSLVSRKHCELFEAGGKLAIRDLGSSNGTFVNGKKINGQQVLKPGDELTVGAVTLRVSRLDGQALQSAQSTPLPTKNASDTAVNAGPVADMDDLDLDNVEVDLDEDEPQDELDLIPLEGDEPVKPAPSKKPQPAKANHADTSKTEPATPGKEDDAIAQFLLDLKLDDDE